MYVNLPNDMAHTIECTVLEVYLWILYTSPHTCIPVFLITFIQLWVVYDDAVYS